VLNDNPSRRPLGVSIAPLDEVRRHGPSGTRCARRYGVAARIRSPRWRARATRLRAATNGLSLLNAHMWTACAPLVSFGTDEQKRRFLPRLCRGELIGGKPRPNRRALRGLLHAHYRHAPRRRLFLNGQRSSSPTGRLRLLMRWRHRPTKGAAGSRLHCRAKAKGFTVVRSLKTWACARVDGRVAIDDCEVPEEIGGQEGAGACHFTQARRERGCILPRRRLHAAVLEARPPRPQLKQFGQSIGRCSLVSSRIVDMKLRLRPRGASYIMPRISGEGRSLSWKPPWQLTSASRGYVVRGRHPDSRRLRLHDRLEIERNWRRDGSRIYWARRTPSELFASLLGCDFDRAADGRSPPATSRCEACVVSRRPLGFALPSRISSPGPLNALIRCPCRT